MGSCPSHPGLSHGRRKSIDIDYPTFKTNVTQYQTQNKTVSKTSIWKEHTLDTDVFDAERTLYLWVGLAECYHGTVKITTHDLILKYVKETVGGTAFSKIKGIIQSDSSNKYNHNTHMHVKFN